MARARTKFKKIYVLDTNIILNDCENIFTLSQNGENLIVLPETVLDELDTKKSGFDEINYQARQFGRMYNEAETLSVDRASNKKFITVAARAFMNDKVAYINVISKKKYVSNSGDFDRSIINDRKIIEIARDMQTEYANVVFISLDIMAKNRALIEGLEVESFNTSEDKEIILSAELNLEKPEPEYSVFDIFSMDVPDTVQHLQITSKDGKPFFYYRSGNLFRLIDEKIFSKHEIKPQNMGQKVLMSQMMDEYFDVVLSDSPAGCVLPGTTIDINFDEKYIPSNEIKKKFNLTNNDLNKLRSKKLVKYKKITNKKILYDLSDFTKITLDYLKLTPKQKTIFDNDKKYTSKYLKLRYWMGTNKSLEYSLNMLKNLRFKYLKYFEPNIDELISNNFNPKNIHNSIIKIQQKILLGYKLPFSSMTEDFWLFRGYSKEEAKEKVSLVQKNTQEDNKRTCENNASTELFNTNILKSESK